VRFRMYEDKMSAGLGSFISIRGCVRKYSTVVRIGSLDRDRREACTYTHRANRGKAAARSRQAMYGRTPIRKRHLSYYLSSSGYDFMVRGFGGVLEDGISYCGSAPSRDEKSSKENSCHVLVRLNAAAFARSYCGQLTKFYSTQC